MPDYIIKEKTLTDFADGVRRVTNTDFTFSIKEMTNALNKFNSETWEFYMDDGSIVEEQIFTVPEIEDESTTILYEFYLQETTSGDLLTLYFDSSTNTWGTWIQSKYNTIGIKISGDVVSVASGHTIFTNDDLKINSLSTLILESYTYWWANVGADEPE